MIRQQPIPHVRRQQEPLLTTTFNEVLRHAGIPSTTPDDNPLCDSLRALQVGAAQRAETVRGFVKDVLPFLADGRLRPLVDKVFAFDELPAAIRFMESDAHVGKIVVRV